MNTTTTNTKHKYYDVIVAWANGEKIQYKEHNDWIDYKYDCEHYMGVPSFNDSNYSWRIKPNTITKRYQMALVDKFPKKEVIAVDISGSSIDDPIEYDVSGFIGWIGDAVEVEIEL